MDRMALGRTAGRLHVYQSVSGLLCTADAHLALLSLLLPPPARHSEKSSLLSTQSHINTDLQWFWLKYKQWTILREAVHTPMKESFQARPKATLSYNVAKVELITAVEQHLTVYHGRRRGSGCTPALPA